MKRRLNLPFRLDNFTSKPFSFFLFFECNWTECARRMNGYQEKWRENESCCGPLDPSVFRPSKTDRQFEPYKNSTPAYGSKSITRRKPKKVTSSSRTIVFQLVARKVSRWKSRKKRSPVRAYSSLWLKLCRDAKSRIKGWFAFAFAQVSSAICGWKIYSFVPLSVVEILSIVEKVFTTNFDHSLATFTTNLQTSGLNFRQLPVAGGTTFSKANFQSKRTTSRGSGSFQYHGELCSCYSQNFWVPVNGSHFENSTVSGICGNFSGKFLFHLSLFWLNRKRPRLPVQKDTRHVQDKRVQWRFPIVSDGKANKRNVHIRTYTRAYNRNYIEKICFFISWKYFYQSFYTSRPVACNLLPC